MALFAPEPSFLYRTLIDYLLPACAGAPTFLSTTIVKTSTFMLVLMQHVASCQIQDALGLVASSHFG